MKVAITGASGFVGRHVLAALMQHDIEIVAILRFDKLFYLSFLEHCFYITRLNIGTMILDHFIWMEHIASDLISPLNFGRLRNLPSLNFCLSFFFLLQACRALRKVSQVPLTYFVLAGAR